MCGHYPDTLACVESSPLVLGPIDSTEGGEVILQPGTGLDSGNVKMDRWQDLFRVYFHSAGRRTMRLSNEGSGVADFDIVMVMFTQRVLSCVNLGRWVGLPQARWRRTHS